MTLYDRNGGSGVSQDPVSGNNYTRTVYVQFAYDNYFGRGLCWTRSKATIYESGAETGGTLYMTLNHCSSQVDSVSLPFAHGPGTFTYYGNEVYAGCAFTRAYLVNSFGYHLPTSGSSNSGTENG